MQWRFNERQKYRGVNNVWSIAHRLKKSKDLMLMLGLNETVDQLAMANSIRWYGHVLKTEDGHVFARALDFEVQCHGGMGG